MSGLWWEELRSMRPQEERTSKGLWWDRAWSLVNGCTPVSAACDHCWAARQGHMWAKNPNEKISKRHIGLTEVYKAAHEVHENVRFVGQAQFDADALDRPKRVKKPQIWAVWNDLFHADVSWSCIDDAMSVMDECRRHLFLVLTKRPDRAVEFFGEKTPYVPRNLWLGTTVEKQEHAHRIEELLSVPGIMLRFLSAEPILGPLDIRQWLDPENGEVLDWVIVGGESGANARPLHPVWVEDLHDHCQATRTPFWFKQYGEWLPIHPMKFGDEYGSGEVVLNFDGQDITGYDALTDSDFGSWLVRKVGKSKAGRLLKGKEFLEWPD